jgi:Fic family protein
VTSPVLDSVLLEQIQRLNPGTMDHLRAEQARDAVARARRLQDLRERHREQLQAGRAAGRLLQGVDLLFGQPVGTMPQVAGALAASYALAVRTIRRLEGAGLLCEIAGQARNRAYRKPML